VNAPREAAPGASKAPVLQRLIDRCLAKEGAYLDNPFGEIPICAKWKGHIFAEIYPRPGDYKITLRCEPDEGRLHKERYPAWILPAYHVPLRQRPHKMTILLSNGDTPTEIPLRELLKMIDRSYENLLRRHGSSSA
jgi:predicted DNA-binding protein (MmcQ/YjbR family)